MSCEHCTKLGRVSFLQGHYNEYRDSGGGHGVYVVQNDLTAEKAQELKEVYEKSHPPVPPEINEKFLNKLTTESARIRNHDDLDWYFGTGRYAQ